MVLMAWSACSSFAECWFFLSLLLFVGHAGILSRESLNPHVCSNSSLYLHFALSAKSYPPFPSFIPSSLLPTPIHDNKTPVSSISHLTMLIKEYRITMPMTSEEYYLAQLYMVARASQEESGIEVGEGVEIARNEPFDENSPINKYRMPPGQYTYVVSFASPLRDRATLSSLDFLYSQVVCVVPRSFTTVRRSCI